MHVTDTKNANGVETIEAVRAFNRFYTHQLGLIGQAFLDSRFTLTEARIIYELANRKSPPAKQLAEDLQLDTAYLSRILKKFRHEGLLQTQPDPQDGRSQLLELTSHGVEMAGELAKRSRAQIADQLEALDSGDREKLAAAMRQIERLLSAKREGDKPAYTIRPHSTGDVAFIVHRQSRLYAEEYGWNNEYEALASVIGGNFLRDFKPGREFCWIAERNGAIAGSVFLVEADTETAKLRLLYVEPSARGLGIGKDLVRHCIAFARNAGYRRMELWTNDVLTAARSLYKAEGFVLAAEQRHHSFGKNLNGQTWTLDL